ncbi:MAG TPA: carbohydrate kinase family protein [Deltaproteobacteria bacterium]|nr:carbohydrate kinase family protein [Deltaproteobacteria bacterium]
MNKGKDILSVENIAKMDMEKSKQFFFVGGVPVFDYMIDVEQDEIVRNTQNKAMFMDTKLFLPVGTILTGKTDTGEEIAINPFACADLMEIGGKHFYSLEFGGKQRQSRDIELAGSVDQVVGEMIEKIPDLIKSEKDIIRVEIKQPVKISLGGNNKNIIAAIASIYSSYGVPSLIDKISMFHPIFFDTGLELWNILQAEYGKLKVNTGDIEDVHIQGLVPRKGYVITVVKPDGTRHDRTILSNRTNEEKIGQERLLNRYQAIEKLLYESSKETDTYLVLNSLTNPEELRLVLHLLQVAYAMQVDTFFCLSNTFLNCASELVSSKSYFRRRMLRWFESPKELIERRVLPYTSHMILNREELTSLEPGIEIKGLERCMLEIARSMNHGRASFSVAGGKLLVSDGRRGVKLAELLAREDAEVFWEKCNLGPFNGFKYAERIISTGDDNVIKFVSTLGAGDTFTGIFIGLAALGWDMGHAMRAATLGAQYFIKTRKLPRLSDLVSLDNEHTRCGTFGRLKDSLFFHMDGDGVLTRYGAIAEKTNAMHTNQLHRPFSDIVKHYCGECK